MAPTGRIQDSDHVKFLLSCVRHSTLEKIDFNMVAKECALPTAGAANKRYESLLKANDIPLKSKRGPDFDIGDRLNVAVAGTGPKKAGGGTPPTKTALTNPDAGDDADGETPSKKRKRASAGATKKDGGAAKKGKKVKEEPAEPEEVKEEGEDDVHESIELGGDFDVDNAVV